MTLFLFSDLSTNTQLQ